VPAATDPRILVDAATRDDAAVFRLAPDRAIVATVDFFTPIVDDAYDFGRIAAANAFSDLYAMGATPLFALNLVGWPRDAAARAAGRGAWGAGEVATGLAACRWGHPSTVRSRCSGRLSSGRHPTDAHQRRACAGDILTSRAARRDPGHRAQARRAAGGRFMKRCA
jgi:hypothetical protein